MTNHRLNQDQFHLAEDIHLSDTRQESILEEMIQEAHDATLLIAPTHGKEATLQKEDIQHVAEIILLEEETTLVREDILQKEDASEREESLSLHV